MPGRQNRFDDQYDQDFNDDLDEQDDLSLDPGKKGIGFGKILVTFVLLFFVLVTGVYAGAYFRLFNARDALNFTGIAEEMKSSDNTVISTMQPLASIATSAIAFVGDVMQSQIDDSALAENKAKEEINQKEQQLSQQEKDLKAQEEKLKANSELAQAQNQANQNSQSNENMKKVAAETAEKNKTADELKKIADERQRELNKRAGKLASYYSSMKPKDAVEIMQYLDNNEIIVILGRMEDEMAAQILAEFEPERASVISQNILKLYPVPVVVPGSGNV